MTYSLLLTPRLYSIFIWSFLQTSFRLNLANLTFRLHHTQTLHSVVSAETLDCCSEWAHNWLHFLYWCWLSKKSRWATAPCKALANSIAIGGGDLAAFWAAEDGSWCRAEMWWGSCGSLRAAQSCKKLIFDKKNRVFCKCD